MRNPRRTRAVALLLASVAFVAPSRARAREPLPGDRVTAGDNLDVAWTTPADCPSSAELRRQVATRVPAGTAVLARGRVEKRAGRYRLSLDISTASSHGERVLEASTCDELVASAAVVIGMSVAPAAERAREEEAAAAPAAASTAPASTASDASASPGASAAVPPSTPASASPDRSTEGPSRRAQESPSRVLVRAELVGDAGLLPSAAVGGGLAVGVVLVRGLTVEATAALFGSQDGTVEASAAGATSSARGASFGLFTAGARACFALTHGIEVAPCLGFEVARIGASGFGAAKVSDADSVTWGPDAILAGRIPVAGPVSVRVGIGALLPISRQSFVINAAGTVHQPAVVALRTFAGPEVRF